MLIISFSNKIVLMNYLSQDDSIPGGFPGMASFRRKDTAFPPVAILSMSWKKEGSN